MSELKPIDIWEDATNAVCQAMQESKMCKCQDGECLASKIEPSEETKRHWNTRAAPDVPELVAMGAITADTGELIKRDDIEENNILHIPLCRKDRAAEIIAAKDKEIDRFTVDECEFGHKYAKMTDHPHKDGRPQCPNCLSIGLTRARDRAEAAEAILAQYEAQEPVAWLCEKLNGDDRFSKVVYNPLSVEQLVELGGEVTPLYASPAPCPDLKAENEKLREALTKISSPTQTAGLLWWQVEARAALNVEASNDKG